MIKMLAKEEKGIQAGTAYVRGTEARRKQQVTFAEWWCGWSKGEQRDQGWKERAGADGERPQMPREGLKVILRTRRAPEKGRRTPGARVKAGGIRGSLDQAEATEREEGPADLCPLPRAPSGLVALSFPLQPSPHGEQDMARRTGRA